MRIPMISKDNSKVSTSDQSTAQRSSHIEYPVPELVVQR